MASNTSVKNRISMFEHHSATPNPGPPTPVSLQQQSPRSSVVRKGSKPRPASFGGALDWRIDDDKNDLIPPPTKGSSPHQRSYVSPRAAEQNTSRRYSSPFLPDKSSPGVLVQKNTPVSLPKHAQNFVKSVTWSCWQQEISTYKWGTIYCCKSNVKGNSSVFSES